MNYVAAFSYSTQQSILIDNSLSQIYDSLTGRNKYWSPKFFSPKYTKISFQVALEQNGSVYLRFGSNQTTGRNEINQSRIRHYAGVNATEINSKNERLDIHFKFTVEIDVEKNRNSGYGFNAQNEQKIVKSTEGLCTLHFIIGSNHQVVSNRLLA